MFQVYGCVFCVEISLEEETTKDLSEPLSIIFVRCKNGFKLDNEGKCRKIFGKSN